MKIKSLTVVLFLFILSCGATSAFADEHLRVRQIQVQTGLVDDNSLLNVLSLAPGQQLEKKDFACYGFYDSRNLYFVIVPRRDILGKSLAEIGLKLWFKGGKSADFGLQFTPAEERALNRNRAFGATQGIEALLPKNVLDRLHAYAPDSDYLAHIRLSQRNRRVSLIAPHFAAARDDSTGSVVLKIPLRNPVYPRARLPVNRKGRVKLQLEIGEEFLARFPNMMRMGSRRGRAAVVPPDNRIGRDAAPQFAYKKVSIELALDSWTEALVADAPEARRGGILAYGEMLAAWSAQSGRNRGGGRGAGPRGGSAAPPLSVQAVFANPALIRHSINYLAALLNIDQVGAAEIYKNYQARWEAKTHLPVLVTLRTNMHESYVSLDRWTVFLEDDERNQYEFSRAVELTEDYYHQFRTNGEGQHKLARRVLPQQMRKYVLLFPKFREDRRPLLGDGGKQVRLVLISNENVDQRVDVLWRVPKTR